jgi:hypothetical protein
MIQLRFLRQTTVDFADAKLRENNVSEKTFHENEVVAVDYVEEAYRGYVNAVFENGDVAIGIDKRNFAIVG